jgi:predicted nucleic acid-binding OB-fold protein
MAIIQHGSFGDTPVTFKKDAIAKMANAASLRLLDKVSLVQQASRSIQSQTLVIPESSNERGLALKSITLKKDFEGFIEKLFKDVNNHLGNDIYFVAWVWDLSGEPPVLFPSPDSSGNFAPQKCIFSVNVSEERTFGGVGINLLGPRKIVGGINVRMQIWESDRKTSDFGKAMTVVADTVKNSQFSLDLISLAVGFATGGVTTAPINLIAKASANLASAVGGILQAQSDDYVDFFEGYYPINYPWKPGQEMTEEGYDCKLVFTML